MHICFVSTYGVECGIATYTEQLAAALAQRGHKITVLAEMQDDQLSSSSEKSGDIHLIRCWKRATPYESPRGLSFVAQIVRALKLDVVHLQHEFGIFRSDEDFLRLVKELRTAAVPHAVTLHTVMEPPKKARFLRGLTDNLSPIVHSLEAAARVPYSHIIPHGIAPRLLEWKNIPLDWEPEQRSKHVFLVPGFLSPNKGVEEILSAYAEALNQEPMQVEIMHLAILGKPRTEEYRVKIEDHIHKLDIDPFVTFRPHFITPAERERWFSLAEWVVLGAGETTPYSASGQLATAIGYGVPIFAKNVPIYHSGRDAGVLYWESAARDRPSTLPQLFARAARGAGRLKGWLKERNQAYAAANTWMVTAQRHLELYAKLS